MIGLLTQSIGCRGEGRDAPGLTSRCWCCMLWGELTKDPTRARVNVSMTPELRCPLNSDVHVNQSPRGKEHRPLDGFKTWAFDWQCPPQAELNQGRMSEERWNSSPAPEKQLLGEGKDRNGSVREKQNLLTVDNSPPYKARLSLA